jgi:hypothetical protein
VETALLLSAKQTPAQAQIKKRSRDMKYAIGSITRVAILTTALTLAAGTSAYAANPCSNATLKGTYGALIRGTAAGLPFAALDVVTSNGGGSFSGSGTIAYNGVISQNVPVSASYLIKADCSGRASFSNGTQQDLLISEDGEEVQFIRTDQLDDQVTGDARRVNQSACSNLSLRGSFAATLGGTSAGLPFAALDSVTAGGDGIMSGKGTVSYNGAISRVQFTAAYAINPDCSGSIAFSTGATQNLIVVGKGSEVRFIRTDSADAVVTGVAKSLRSAP